MSKGVMIHAFGDDVIDYYQLALTCAKLAKKNLKLPIVCVTDKDFGKDVFDDIIMIESKTKQKKTLKTKDSQVRYNYKNDTRSLSYDLTPFEQTLVIDSDYLVFNNNLLRYFDLYGLEVACPKAIFDIVSGQQVFNYISGTIRQEWATLIYFTKSKHAAQAFEHWKMIQKNYSYYSKLLGVYGHLRNDYALSIASHTMNGFRYAWEYLEPINWIPSSSNLLEIRTNGEVLISINEKVIKLSQLNLHFMDKVSLLRPEIQKQLEEYASTI